MSPSILLCAVAQFKYVSLAPATTHQLIIVVIEGFDLWADVIAISTTQGFLHRYTRQTSLIFMAGPNIAVLVRTYSTVLYTSLIRQPTANLFLH